MLKATTTITQAKNIAMALTISFAAATLVTACGSDESADTQQSQQPELSSENQSTMDMTEDNASTASNTEEAMENEPVAEVEQLNTQAEPETTATSASTDDAAAKADEPKSEGTETHVVTAQGLAFAPLVIKINPGDVVSWRNMSTHNSESIDGLIPEGAEKWNSPMSQNFERTFNQEGIYVYKCTPHIGAGMGGVIIVGNPVNLEQIKNADVSGAAGRLAKKAISEAESM